MTRRLANEGMIAGRIAGRIAGVIVMVLGACGDSRVPAPAPPPGEAHQVGGSVRGLWDGSEGVTLALEANGASSSLTVSANGTFHFADPVTQGAAYAVKVASNPMLHTCVVEAGGAGAIADADVVDVSIACAGPAVEIALSGQWGWTFDPTKDAQTFSGSVVAQDVAFTISGASLTSATVGGAAATLGKATPPMPLSLGATMVPVAVTAGSGLSKTYQLAFDRGGAILDQVVYGKASNPGANNLFGTSVALSGDTLAVGAWQEASAATGVNGNQDDKSAAMAGAVYVFVRSGTTWTQQAYLKASNTGAGDFFGYAVALSGDTLAVGAYGEDSAATGIGGDDGNDNAGDAGAVYVFVRDGTTWTQQAYVKASNTGAGDNFGVSVALSGDTLAVGANREDSATTGVNLDQAAGTAVDSGAVYVFARNDTTWAQQAYVKASNTEANDLFGTSVALSGDTLAVGAYGEDSAATGIDGDQGSNGASNAGAAYVFARKGVTWTQQAYVKASNAGASDFFGYAVALSGDTLAVGAQAESSAATGVGGNQADNTATSAGAVYVFVRDGTAWSQQAYLKASNTGTKDQFGSSVALFGDVLAVGAWEEASAAAGIDGNQADNTAGAVGAVYVFTRTGTTWAQKHYVKASNAGAGDVFGASVALSKDTLVIGASGEASGAAGINPESGQTDEARSGAGAVYIFR